MTRPLTYSTLLHLFFLGWLLLHQSFLTHKEETFFIDFIAEPSSGGGTSLASPAAAISRKPTVLPVKTVNSKEDLLLKSKEVKKSKVKEKIMEIPQAPPLPRVLDPPLSKDNAVPGIPGVDSSQSNAGSGVGIGLEVGSDGGSFTGTQFQYGWYIQGMKKKLDSNWVLVSQSLSRVSAQIAFIIEKNGAVHSIAVEKSSGETVFDQAALRAVKLADPLPPLPSEFSEKELRVHVRFTLKN